MNISKKRSVESDTVTLAYYLDNILSERKINLRNYWLQKKEIKDQVKEHNAKLDEIARFVTKYISSRKTQK
jgi:hypothetical protein